MQVIVTSAGPLAWLWRLRAIYKGIDFKDSLFDNLVDKTVGEKRIGQTIDELSKKTELTFTRPTIIQMAGEFFLAENVKMAIAKDRLKLCCYK